MFIRLQSIAELKSKNRYAQLKNICSKKYSYSQVGAREGGGETGVCIDMSTIWSNPALGKCGQCGKVWQYGNLRVSAAAILPTVGIHRLTQHCHRRLWSLVICAGHMQGMVTTTLDDCFGHLTKNYKWFECFGLFSSLLAVYICQFLGADSWHRSALCLLFWHIFAQTRAHANHQPALK